MLELPFGMLNVAILKLNFLALTKLVFVSLNLFQGPELLLPTFLYIFKTETRSFLFCKLKRGVAQLVARQARGLEVIGSNPIPRTFSSE